MVSSFLTKVTRWFASVCFEVNKRWIPVSRDPPSKWIRFSVDSEVNLFHRVPLRVWDGRDAVSRDELMSGLLNDIMCTASDYGQWILTSHLTWCSLKMYRGWDQGSPAVYVDTKSLSVNRRGFLKRLPFGDGWHWCWWWCGVAAGMRVREAVQNIKDCSFEDGETLGLKFPFW